MKKEDGSPGSFGYIWNTGDYYWKGKKFHLMNPVLYQISLKKMVDSRVLLTKYGNLELMM